jgi:hypothetical protein
VLVPQPPERIARATPAAIRRPLPGSHGMAVWAGALGGRSTLAHRHLSGSWYGSRNKQPPAAPKPSRGGGSPARWYASRNGRRLAGPS